MPARELCAGKNVARGPWPVARLVPVVAAAITLMVLGQAAGALDVPAPPTRYLSDFAGVVSADRAAEIEALLAGIEQRTGHQVMAATFASLEGEALEDFTMRAAERWRVGRKGLDDGVIFFAFVADRRLRIEVGYGLEDKVTDAVSARLLADTVKPAFRAGDYGGGIAALARALEGVFRGDPPPPRRERGAPGGALGEAALLFTLIVIVLMLNQLSRRGGGGAAMRRGGWSTTSRRGGGSWGGYGGGSWGGGGSGGGGSFGGFSGGGGSFGGGGASGSW